jgi:large subunit ribosomal protein L22
VATTETPRTEVRAVAKYVRTAPRKAQLVADQIRGRPVPDATTVLRFMTRDAARDIEKVLRSAVANAEANHGLDGDELVVARAEIGAGPTLKRWRARARGRVGRIRKRTCHITIAVALPAGADVELPVEEPAKPKRRARTKPEPPAQAEAATGVTPAESAPVVAEDAEAPKPKRTTRKKAEPAAVETSADDTAAAEKPKPKRARSPRQPAANAPGEGPGEEKPQRASRRKKTEPTEESEGS